MQHQMTLLQSKHGMENGAVSDAQRSTNTVVTVRGLSIELKGKLRVRAAHNARSMEAEARAILERALMAPEEDAIDLATFARSLFKPLGGAELELPGREPMREPPPLSDLATDIPCYDAQWAKTSQHPHCRQAMCVHPAPFGGHERLPARCVHDPARYETYFQSWCGRPQMLT